MKNIIIIGGVGFAVYWFMVKRDGVQAAPAYTSGGLITTDTKGRAVQFQQDKNGYLYDQFGRAWA